MLGGWFTSILNQKDSGAGDEIRTHDIYLGNPKDLLTTLTINIRKKVSIFLYN